MAAHLCRHIQCTTGYVVPNLRGCLQPCSPRCSLSLCLKRLFSFQLANPRTATAINYAPWALVNFVFNRIIYKRYYAWWIKYNYILAAALDTGLALSGIVIFFAVTYGPVSRSCGLRSGTDTDDNVQGVQFPNWYGNTVWFVSSPSLPVT